MFVVSRSEGAEEGREFLRVGSVRILIADRI